MGSHRILLRFFLYQQIGFRLCQPVHGFGRAVIGFLGGIQFCACLRHLFVGILHLHARLADRISQLINRSHLLIQLGLELRGLTGRFAKRVYVIVQCKAKSDNGSNGCRPNVCNHGLVQTLLRHLCFYSRNALCGYCFLCRRRCRRLC